VKERKLPARAAGRHDTGRPFSLAAWYGGMAVFGFGFGLIAERRPFGDDILLHPLVVFFVLMVMALLALRIVLKRPVPEVIPDRALMIGCVAGLAMFLAGNFGAAHLTGILP
jgi:drug/metabolite transporter (DMT)-like permease